MARPGAFGGDVSHLNLHKTFCIPHGGGGPGVGPVAVAAHLVPFLPGGEGVDGVRVGAVSAAPYGSPGVLLISWMYVRMMGVAGMRRATLTAVAAANYVAKRLGEHFPVLYSGMNHGSAGSSGAVGEEEGFVAHECILDLRRITKTTGVTTTWPRGWPTTACTRRRCRSRCRARRWWNRPRAKTFRRSTASSRR